MNELVRKFLIDRARQRTSQTIHYQELCNACGLKLDMSNPDHRNQIAVILRDISREENRHKRPLLSALVLRAEDQLEGDGFYKLADELGFGDWRRLKREGIFEVQQINECIAFWSDDRIYVQFY